MDKVRLVNHRPFWIRVKKNFTTQTPVRVDSMPISRDYHEIDVENGYEIISTSKGTPVLYYDHGSGEWWKIDRGYTNKGKLTPEAGNCPIGLTYPQANPMEVSDIIKAREQALAEL